MITVNSKKITQNTKDSFSYEFKSNTPNSGVIEIIEPLLKDFECAKTRAEYELITKGLRAEIITFNTYNPTLKLGQTIKVMGLNYKITKISLSINDNSALVKIKAIRYYKG